MKKCASYQQIQLSTCSMSGSYGRYWKCIKHKRMVSWAQHLTCERDEIADNNWNRLLNALVALEALKSRRLHVRGDIWDVS